MSQTKRYPFLDILRGLAIVLIMLHHFRLFPGAPEWFKWFALRGFVGVDVFFVLSGWLIGGQLFRIYRETGRISILNFWFRRWWRTFPAYYAAVAAVVLVGFKKPQSFLEFGFFLQNYFHPRDWLVTWSLCVEEHFYFFLPFLLLFLIAMRRLGQGVIALSAVSLILLSPILRYGMMPEIEKHDYLWFLSEVYSPTHFRLDGLFIGVALAALREWKTKLWQLMERNALVLGILGFLILVFANWGPPLTGVSTEGSARMTLYSVVFLFPLVYLGVAFLVTLGTCEKWGDQLCFPGSRWFSDHAYTLYLTHELSIWTLETWVPKTFQGEVLEINFWLSLFLAFCLSFVFSIILRNAVELPGLRLRSKWAPLNRVN